MAKKKLARSSSPKKSRKGVGGRPRKRWIEDYANVGKLPEDPLHQVEWGLKILMVSLKKTVEDPDIDEKTRTHEIRQVMRTVKDLMPAARMAEAERRILEFEAAKNAPPAPTGAEEGELRDAAPDDPAPLATDYRQLRGRGGSVRRPAAGSAAEPEDQ